MQQPIRSPQRDGLRIGGHQICGRGAAKAMHRSQQHRRTPHQRQARCQIASHNPPSDIATSAASGKAGASVTAPGKPETNRPTASITPMPKPSRCSGTPSSPNGIASNDSAAAGITTRPIIGIASRCSVKMARGNHLQRFNGLEC